MADLIRKNKLLGNNKTIIGDGQTDIVLDTLGKVYVKSGNNFKLINEIFKQLDKLNNKSNEDFLKSVTVVEDIEKHPYPGDGYLIFDASKTALYLSYDGRYILILDSIEITVPNNLGEHNNENIDTGILNNYVKKTGDTMTGALAIVSKGAPLIIASPEFVANLNVEFINGLSSEDLAVKKRDEQIFGKWSFEDKATFNKRLVVNDSIGSSYFMDGYNGLGWSLDTSSNTLTLDYLIVRKAMHVFELVVNLIRATNGSLWITDTCKIKEVTDVIKLDITQISEIQKITTFNWYILQTDLETIQIAGTHLADSTGNVPNQTTFYNFDKLIKFNKLLNTKQEIQNALSDLNNNSITKVPTFKKFRGQIGNAIFNPEKTPMFVSVTTDDKNNQTLHDIYIYYKYFGIKNINNRIFNNLKVITLEDDMYPTILEGDLIRCLKFLNGNIKYYDALVSSLLDDYTFLIFIADSVFDKYTDIDASVHLNSKFYSRTNLTTNIRATLEESEQFIKNNEQSILASPAAGDELVRIGNIVDTSRLGSMYLSSSDANSPNLKVLDSINRPDYTVSYTIPKFKILKSKEGIVFYYRKIKGDETPDYEDLEHGKVKLFLTPNSTCETYKYPGTNKIMTLPQHHVKTLVGNLNGIIDPVFEDNQPLGYGLYGENVYLTGEFILKSTGNSISSEIHNIKRRVFQTQPNPPYDTGDLWVNAELKIGEETIFDHELAVCMHSLDKFANDLPDKLKELIAKDWKASLDKGALLNFITAVTLNYLNLQDNLIDTYYYPDPPPTVNPYEHKEPFKEWFKTDTAPTEEEKAKIFPKHVGDLYLNSTDKKTYRFIVDGNTKEYKWVEVTDPNIQEVMNIAKNALDTADNKRRVFIIQKSNTLPTPPYDQGDLWVNATYEPKFNNDLAVCVNAKSDPEDPTKPTESATIDDWVTATSYLNKDEITNIVKDAVGGFLNLLDGKIDIWYIEQVPTTDINSDPCKLWGTYTEIPPNKLEIFKLHKGDLCYNLKTGLVYRFDATNSDPKTEDFRWLEIKNSQLGELGSELDGKRTIYTKCPQDGNYKVNDLWVNAYKLKNRSDVVDPTQLPYPDRSKYEWYNDIVVCTQDGNGEFNYNDWKLASEYKQDIDNFSSIINDILADNKITPLEKRQLKIWWDLLTQEYNEIIAKCTVIRTYDLGNTDGSGLPEEESGLTNFKLTYSNLQQYIDPLIKNSMTSTTTIAPGTNKDIQESINAYNRAKQTLLSYLNNIVEQNNTVFIGSFTYTDTQFNSVQQQISAIDTRTSTIEQTADKISFRVEELRGNAKNIFNLSQSEWYIQVAFDGHDPGAQIYKDPELEYGKIVIPSQLAVDAGKYGGTLIIRPKIKRTVKANTIANYVLSFDSRTHLTKLSGAEVIINFDSNTNTQPSIYDINLTTERHSFPFKIDNSESIQDREIEFNIVIRRLLYNTYWISDILIEEGEIATIYSPNEKEGLLSAAGIDITSKEIVLTADKTKVQTPNKEPIALFGTTPDGKPVILADLLQVGEILGISTTYEDSTKIKDVSFQYNGVTYNNVKLLGEDPVLETSDIHTNNYFNPVGVLHIRHWSAKAKDKLYQFDIKNGTVTSTENNLIIGKPIPNLTTHCEFSDTRVIKNVNIIYEQNINKPITYPIITINSLHKGESVLYWPDGSVMNCKIFKLSNNTITGCVEYFLSKGGPLLEDINKGDQYIRDTFPSFILLRFDYFEKIIALEFYAKTYYNKLYGNIEWYNCLTQEFKNLILDVSSINLSFIYDKLKEIEDKKESEIYLKFTRQLAIIISENPKYNKINNYYQCQGDNAYFYTSSTTKYYLPDYLFNKNCYNYFYDKLGENHINSGKDSEFKSKLLKDGLLIILDEKKGFGSSPGIEVLPKENISPQPEVDPFPMPKPTESARIVIQYVSGGKIDRTKTLIFKFKNGKYDPNY